MADPIEKAKDVLHEIEHPVETAKALEHEAAEGVSERTPLIAITGITLVLVVIFAILVTVTLVVYFMYGGK